ncbi:pyrroline-5-carboxylate reductase family protein, partial [Streptococcus pyogenes]
AMTSAGVQNGLSVADSQLLASQTVLGSAQMVLETGQHPAHLRDQVTSPGGSTIAGVVAMTQEGFQAATMEAVNAALDKTRE